MGDKLEDLSRDELYERAKKQGVEGRSDMTREELLNALQDHGAQPGHQTVKRSPPKRWYKNYGLSLALLVLFLASWVGQLIAQWMTYTDEQADHGEPARIGDFVSHFFEATFENWQSEFLQLFTMVVLTTILIHKSSAESRDSSDQMQESLARIERRLNSLESS